MTIFVPASGSSDSSYLLYKVLTETTDAVITRISFIEASVNEVDKKRKVCEWLYQNVRPFDYGIAEYDITEDYNLKDEPPSQTYKRLIATSASLATKFKCDKISFGYNLHNWSMTNWFYNSDEDEIGNDSFYNRKSKYNNLDENLSYQTHFVIRDVNPDITIEWPFMWNKKDRDSALGRWQIWESLPLELKSIISLGCTSERYKQTLTDDVCGTCGNCLSFKWYRYVKKHGLSAKMMDHLIMKEGQFGKYWTPQSNPSTRYKAYDDLRSTLLVLEI